LLGKFSESISCSSRIIGLLTPRGVIILEDKKKLYVGNLPYSVTSEELKNIFSEFGDIADAVVITDRGSGRSKGFGFVEFATEEAAQKALEAMADKELEGRKLVVNFARPPRER
jgi:RNA recognition motif-containing protein